VKVTTTIGEVAVMHSEPLQLECNDVKHMTEKEVYPPKLNAEDLPGEKTLSTSAAVLFHCVSFIVLVVDFLMFMNLQL